MKADDFTLNILGCGSAMPTKQHQPSCQVVNHRETLYMIDCGEGAQLMFRRMCLKFSRLRHIFISHLHGDHCFGLPGLLSTMALQEVGGKVSIHIHERGAEIFSKTLQAFCHDFPFNIEWDIIAPGRAYTLLDTDSLSVETFPLDHKMASNGFLFREKPKPRHIIGDMVEFHKVPLTERTALKEGKDFVTEDGRVIANHLLTTDADPSVSYAYCSDTRPTKSVVEAVKGVDWLYHEATYADDMAAMASKYAHSTARQAAEIAAEAHVGKLIIGHFSKRYTTPDLLLKQAKEVFPNVMAADEGMKIDLGNGKVRMAKH